MDKYGKPRAVAQALGLSYDYVLQCCRNKRVGHTFAQPTKTDKNGRCTGNYIININKFVEALDRGYLVE